MFSSDLQVAGNFWEFAQFGAHGGGYVDNGESAKSGASSSDGIKQMPIVVAQGTFPGCGAPIQTRIPFAGANILLNGGSAFDESTTIQELYSAYPSPPDDIHAHIK